VQALVQAPPPVQVSTLVPSALHLPLLLLLLHLLPRL
jgi:hypothetical protein